MTIKSLPSVKQRVEGQVAPDWQRIKAVYCDSRAALAEAWRRGVPRHVPVWTSAPALMVEPELKAECVDASIMADRYRALEDATLAIAYETWSRLKGLSQDIAIIAARTAIQPLQSYVFKAAWLREEHFGDPLSIVTIRSANPALDQRFHSTLVRLLQGNSSLRVIEVWISDLNLHDDPRPPVPDPITRLLGADLLSWTYKVAEAVWQWVPFAGPRGSVLVVQENELLKETVAALVLRGFSVHKVKPPRVAHDALPDGLSAEISESVQPIVKQAMRPLVTPAACRVLERVYAEEVINAVARQRASVSAWRTRLDSLSSKRPQAVLTNGIFTPEAIGLYAATQERGLPLVMFQHGVSREIAHSISRYQPLFENSACDLLVVFNEEAEKLSNASPFRRGRAVSVGLPSDYCGKGGHGIGRKWPPVWYISTALYNGNLTVLARGACDVAIAEWETRLITGVLGRLPHRVLYKPYPGERYLDPDPVVKQARTTANIEVYDGRLDLRYLVKQARVLVTSRATSTLSWCLMSGKPTIYIDHPCQMPLREEARKELAKGIFLFDAARPDCCEQLTAFLSRPLEEIEREWKALAPARERVLRRFICKTTTGAGGEAAGLLVRQDWHV
jgi:hypothetical protein